MKILKYLLVLLVALVVTFFAFGIFMPSVDYSYEIRANKSLKEAWAVSQDESKFGKWLNGFKSTELISGEKFEVGAKSRIIVNPGEEQEDFEMIETIEAVKEFDYVKMKYVSDMMDFDHEFSFEESGEGTVVKSESTVMGKGIIMRSLFAVMETFGGTFKKQEGSNMEALKKVIEENTTDYFATDSVNKVEDN